MALNLQEEYNKTNIQGIIEQLEEDLVGLGPVKARIKEISALLLVQRLRKNLLLSDYICHLQVAPEQVKPPLLIGWLIFYLN
jgi:hypothetical protein